MQSEGGKENNNRILSLDIKCTQTTFLLHYLLTIQLSLIT